MDHPTRRGVMAGAAALVPGMALAQATSGKISAGAQLGQPQTVISNPPRQWGPDAPPQMFPDPDIIVVDPGFNRLRLSQSNIHRIATGFQWAEGPAWSAEGQYALFSDVKGDVQYRYIWETGEITPFRRPSYNSNGNAFDFQGRQVSCQHYLRRLVRWEHDGSLTVIADHYQGKHINSPDDVACHLDGSIWFTDPPFGGSLNEGHPDAPGQGNNAAGILNPYAGEGGLGLPNVGQEDGAGNMAMELPANTYRWDPSGRLDIVFTPEKLGTPNGICFSPDYKIVYTMGSGKIYASDIDGAKVANTRVVTDCMVDGIACRPDGMRTDRAGNLWIGSTSVIGYSGVTIWNPQGKLLGRIRLPETCANICFAGPKRDYLFMCAATSIYMVRVNIQGSSPG
jgi:gluconolactonase